MSNETVAENSNEASKTTEGNGSAQGDDLDKVLSEIDEEFDQGIKTPGPSTDKPTKPKESQDIDGVREDVNYLLSEIEESAIDKAVDAISKDLEGVPATKKVIKAMLNDMAIDDPRVKKAFQNRRRDPSGWNKVLEAASKVIGKEFSGLPDKQLNDDRDALAATVRGASKTSSEDDAPNFSKMSDAEFDEYKRKHG